MRLPREVYVIQHNVTKRCYVGSSFNVEHRYRNHLYQLRLHKHINEDMQKDFDTYGEDYTFKVVDRIDEFEERSKEYKWMMKLNSGDRKNGYNYNDPFIKAMNRRKLNREHNLLEIIRESENPSEALDIAIGICRVAINHKQA